jgi:hypothetical protein
LRTFVVLAYMILFDACATALVAKTPAFDSSVVIIENADDVLLNDFATAKRITKVAALRAAISTEAVDDPRDTVAYCEALSVLQHCSLPRVSRRETTRTECTQTSRP